MQIPYNGKHMAQVKPLVIKMRYILLSGWLKECHRSPKYHILLPSIWVPPISQDTIYVIKRGEINIVAN